MGEARTIRHEGASGEASSGAWAEAGRATRRALNASSRQGPQPGVPGVPIAVSAMPGNSAAQAQNPSSTPPLPFAEMQTEPLTMGGKTRISWSSERIRTDRLQVLIGQRLSWKRGLRSSCAPGRAHAVRGRQTLTNQPRLGCTLGCPRICCSAARLHDGTINDGRRSEEMR